LESTWAFIYSCFILIIIVFSVKNELRVLEANVALCTLYFLSSFLVILSSFDHFIGDGIAAYAAALIVALPCLYFVWANRGDYTFLCDTIALSLMVVGSLFLIVSLFAVHPIWGERYKGITSNPNGMGAITVAVFVCGAYLVFKSKLIIYAFAAVSLILSFCVIVLSGSRTSLLVVASTIIICIIRLVQIFAVDRGLGRKILFRALGTVAVMGIIGVIVMQANETISVARVYEELRSVLRVQVFDPENRRGVGFLNRLSSGRTAVWLDYFHNLNFKGNDVTEALESYSGQRLPAHNNVLEIAWRSGIFAGFVYAGMLIWSLCYSAKSFFRRSGQRNCTLFLFVIIIGYFITVMLESMIIIFSFPVVQMYFLSIGMLFFSDKDKKTEKLA
jgi:O-antigen ligase